MAQHRRQGMKNTRRIASTAALAATAAVVAPGVAQAAEVVVPNTDYRFEVAGLENVPNIDQVPNIDRYVPSLGKVSNQQNTNYAAAGHKQAAPAQQTVGQKALAAARSVIGSPYVYGAAGPNAFDCSGLTSWHTLRLASRFRVPLRHRLPPVPRYRWISCSRVTSLLTTVALPTLVSTPATAPSSTPSTPASQFRSAT